MGYMFIYIFILRKEFHYSQAVLYKEGFSKKRENFYWIWEWILDGCLIVFFFFVLYKRYVVYNKQYEAYRKPLEDCAVKRLWKEIVDNDPKFEVEV